MTILKTPQAADALGCSVSYLKRQRDTHGGFLELGKHYHRKPSSNASITWDVDLIRAEMNKRTRASRPQFPNAVPNQQANSGSDCTRTELSLLAWVEVLADEEGRSNTQEQ